jgi:hypothetical protein
VLTGFIPPCTLRSALAPLASTAARSAVRDDVRPPLSPDQDEAENAIKQKFCKDEYFDGWWLTEG